MSEARDALKAFLRSDKVRGKPVLLLCNKTDVETAEEMDVVVDTLQLEVGLCQKYCSSSARIIPSIPTPSGDPRHRAESY